MSLEIRLFLNIIVPIMLILCLGALIGGGLVGEKPRGSQGATPTTLSLDECFGVCDFAFEKFSEDNLLCVQQCKDAR